MRVARSAAWALAILTLAAPSAAIASSHRRAEAPDARPPRLTYEVVSRRPHDPAAFTQGLVLDPGGRMFESTGLLGRSSLREVEPLGGDVLRIRTLADDLFGEGIALVDDRLIQLTWQNGIATAWDAATFEPTETFAYDGEGWGLCHDGTRLVMSDGSDRLAFRDPLTFEMLGGVDVTVAGRSRDALNELECAEGAVWANLYMTDRIVRIDPATGDVTGILDLEGIIEPHPEEARPDAVLNGIAYDPLADTYLVTGKLWPELIEIRVGDPRSDGEPSPSPSATAPSPAA